MTSLNDDVVNWSVGQGFDADYDPAKYHFLNGRAPGRVIKDNTGDDTLSWNDAVAKRTEAGVLNEAVLWLDSRWSSSSGEGEPRVRNLGTGDTTGVTGAVIYDGKVLLPGTNSANYWSVPDADELDITGDLDIRMRVALDDWSDGSTNYFASKWFASTNQRSWLFSVGATGLLGFSFSDDGVVNNGRVSTSPVPFGDGESGWVRVAFDVDNGSGQHVATFYYAADSATEPTEWTSLGSSIAAGTASIFSSSANVEAGINNGFGVISGSTYRLVLRDGIDGTTVLDVDLDNVPDWSSSFTAATGQTVTLNTTAADFGAPSALDAKYGSVLGVYVYDGAAMLPGVAGNNLTVPDEAALDITGDIEVVVRAAPDVWVPGTSYSLAGKDGGSSNRAWQLQVSASGRFQFSCSTDGTSVEFPSSDLIDFPDGSWKWVKATLDLDDGAGNRKYSYFVSDDGVSWTPFGTGIYAGTWASLATNGAAVSLVSPNPTASYNIFEGRVDRLIIRDGIDGPTVLDVNLSGVTDYAESFTAATGQTVTVNSTSSDTNDPLFLPWSGENYIYFPNAVGNVAIADPAGVTAGLTGDVTIEFDAEIGAWPVAADSYFGGVGANAASGGNSFSLYAQADGRLRAVVGTSSGAQFPQSDVVALNPGRHLFKLHRDATTGLTSFLVDGVDVGSGATAAGGVVFAGDAVNVGSARLATAGLGGNIYRMTVLDGTESTVFEFNGSDVTDAGATSFTATSGQTVTVNRGTSGRKTTLVTRPVWLFGTDDYLEVADNALVDFGADDDFTLLAVIRQFDTLAGTRTLTKGIYSNGVQPSWGMIAPVASSGFNGFIDDNSANRVLIAGTSAPAYTANSLASTVLVRNGGTNEITSYVDNTAGVPKTDLTTGTLENSYNVRVGANSSVSYFNGEIVAAAIWRRALTAEEVEEVVYFYESGTAPSITTTEVDDLTVGIPFSQNFTATGSDDIVWTVEPAANLSMSSSGTLSGTPTSAGWVTLRVTATNSAGSDTAEFRVKVAETPLEHAVLWLDAARSVVGEGEVRNLGTGGGDLDAVYGAGVSADTNDPLFLSHTGENYVYLPRTNTDYLRSPTSSVTMPTSGMEVVCRASRDDWASGSLDALVGSFTGGGSGVDLQVDTTGELRYVSYGSGGTRIALATAPVPFTDGEIGWIRAVMEYSSGDVTFYTAADSSSEPSSWTQLGDVVAGAGVTDVFGPVTVTIGNNVSLARPWNGKIYRVIIRDAVTGSVDFDFNSATDITDSGATSFSATSGQTVTVNRGTSGRKTALVTRPIWLFGTDDYLEVADNDLLDFGDGQDFTLFAVFRLWANPVASGRIMDKRGGTATGYEFRNGFGTPESALLSIGDGTNNGGASAPVRTFGPLESITMVKDTEITGYLGTTAGTPLNVSSYGSLENALALRIGSTSGGSSYNEMEAVAFAVWRRALTADEITLINSYYGTV